MATETGKITVSGLTVDTVRKEIKNMHLGVYPPTGRIRVAVPLDTSEEAMRLFVVSKLSWIKKQQRQFWGQERESKREYVPGESHYFLGRRYRLNVINTEKHPKVEIKGKSHINLHIHKDASREHKERVMERFYRQELRKLIPDLLQKWSKKIEAEVQEVKIKKMKTKWGTCNPKAGRIWLNLELAKKPLQCIEYVIVHELVHLLEKSHTDRFMNILQNMQPLWQQYRSELNTAPLGYSVWES